MKSLVYVIFVILFLVTSFLLIYYYLLTHNYFSILLQKVIEQAKNDCKQTEYSYGNSKEAPEYILSLLTKAGVELGSAPSHTLPENIKFFSGGLISGTKYCYYVAFGTKSSDEIMVYEDSKGNLKKIRVSGIKEK
jgi:hypothetical protein